MSHLLLGEPCYNVYAKALEKYGYAPVALPPDARLNKTVSTHADTLIFACRGEYVANADYARTLPSFVRERLTLTDEAPYGAYPTDTAFNALVLGGKLFARLDTCAEAVRVCAERHGLASVNVRQGYARCSTLALIAASAAVTADAGMARTMSAHGIDVLTVSAGHVVLEGCEYGFIGGASFVDEASRCVFFFGDLSAHPDGEPIEAFLASRGYAAISLGGALTDFGGAVVV